MRFALDIEEVDEHKTAVSLEVKGNARDIGCAIAHLMNNDPFVKEVILTALAHSFTCDGEDEFKKVDLSDTKRND